VPVLRRERTLTREHVLPRWLTEFFPDVDPFTATSWRSATADEVATFSRHDGVPLPRERTDRRDRPVVNDFGIIARAVCCECDT
jgi:hypothetical protein